MFKNREKGTIIVGFLIAILLLSTGVLAGWGLKYLYAIFMLSLSRNKAKAILQASVEIAKNESLKIIEQGEAQLEKETEYVQDELKHRDETLKELDVQLKQKTKLVEDRVEAIRQRRSLVIDRENKVAVQHQEVQDIRETYHEKLELANGITRAELSSQLVQTLINQEKSDALHVILKTENETDRTKENLARDLLINTLQRLPPSQTSAYSPTILETPTNDMIMRLISREGRNILLLERLLGVNIYIEDTPEGFNLTSPDHIKREVARATIDRLFKDKRFNPVKIEETIRTVTGLLNETMVKEAKSVLTALKINNFCEDAIRTLGRLLYRYSYGQNQLYHSMETAQIASMLAREIGGNPEIAIRGGLLHDIGKVIAVDGKAHVEIGVEAAQGWGEGPEVINCIAAHHDDAEKTCIEAVLVQIADAISGARPGARRETITSYMELVQNLEGIASEYDGVEKAFAIYAGRELRILVNSEKVTDERALELAHAVAQRIESELAYPGKIKVTLIREMKVSQFTH